MVISSEIHANFSERIFVRVCALTPGPSGIQCLCTALSGRIAGLVTPGSEIDRASSHLRFQTTACSAATRDASFLVQPNLAEYLVVDSLLDRLLRRRRQPRRRRRRREPEYRL